MGLGMPMRFYSNQKLSNLNRTKGETKCQN